MGLIRSNFSIGVKYQDNIDEVLGQLNTKNRKLLEATQELTLASNSVDTEAKMTKIRVNMHYDDSSAPSGPSGRAEKIDVIEREGMFIVPLLFLGHLDSIDRSLSFLGRRSQFGANRIEGVVIKNYEKQLMGKIVDPAFDTEVDNSTHPMRRERKQNRLSFFHGWEKVIRSIEL